MKLRGNLLLRDVFVVRWKRVSLEAEWADPYSCPGVHIPVTDQAISLMGGEKSYVREGIQDCSAWLLASDWLVL